MSSALGNAIDSSSDGRIGYMRGSANHGSMWATSFILSNTTRYRGSLELKVNIGVVMIGGVVATVIVKDAIFFFKRGSLELACETELISYQIAHVFKEFLQSSVTAYSNPENYRNLCQNYEFRCISTLQIYFRGELHKLLPKNLALSKYFIIPYEWTPNMK